MSCNAFEIEHRHSRFHLALIFVLASCVLKDQIKFDVEYYSVWNWHFTLLCAMHWRLIWKGLKITRGNVSNESVFRLHLGRTEDADGFDNWICCCGCCGREVSNFSASKFSFLILLYEGACIISKPSLWVDWCNKQEWCKTEVNNVANVLMFCFFCSNFIKKRGKM